MLSSSSGASSLPLWILGSVFSSVGLILINKVIMGPEFQFSFVFSLTAAHFLVTALGMEILAILGFFTRSSLPMKDTVIMAVFCIGSVAFMNFSLKLNSVGFYQLTKLLCIPCMVSIQTFIYHMRFTRKVKCILFFILIGVGVATINDVELNFEGSVLGLLAVFFTSQFQIWQGEKQKLFSLSPMQMNHTQGMPSFLFCFVLSLLFEYSGDSPTSNVLLHEFKPWELMYIAASCFLALSVNLCTYGLIGKTSPVTYQVVGHAKTILVLLGGFALEAMNRTRQGNLQPPRKQKQLFETVVGIVLAMVGVIIYGHLRHYESLTPRPADILDRTLPSFVLQFLVDPPAQPTAAVEMNAKEGDKGNYEKVNTETPDDD